MIKFYLYIIIFKGKFVSLALTHIQKQYETISVAEKWKYRAKSAQLLFGCLATIGVLSVVIGSFTGMDTFQMRGIIFLSSIGATTLLSLSACWITKYVAKYFKHRKANIEMELSGATIYRAIVSEERNQKEDIKEKQNCDKVSPLPFTNEISPILCKLNPRQWREFFTALDPNNKKSIELFKLLVSIFPYQVASNLLNLNEGFEAIIYEMPDTNKQRFQDMILDKLKCALNIYYPELTTVSDPDRNTRTQHFILYLEAVFGNLHLNPQTERLLDEKTNSETSAKTVENLKKILPESQEKEHFLELVE